MKKIITLAIIITLFISCKKDIECTCTTTFTGTGKQSYSYISYETYNTTKRQAKINQCADSEVMVPIEVNLGGVQSNNGTTKRTCKIK